MRISDWSSDVCSSDLVAGPQRLRGDAHGAVGVRGPAVRELPVDAAGPVRTGLPQAEGRRPARGTVTAGAGKTDRPRPVQRARDQCNARRRARSEEHTSELQSLMRISYAVFCLKKKKITNRPHNTLH